MQKQSTKLFLCFALLLCAIIGLLTSCNSQNKSFIPTDDGLLQTSSDPNDISTSASNSINRATEATEDVDLQQVFECLENGKYKQAQQIFENNIAGNIKKEKAAQIGFEQYIQASIRDVSAGKLSLEDALLFCEAGYKGGFTEYLSDFELTLDTIRISMRCFADGKNNYINGNYKLAYLELNNVSPLDANFGNALEIIYQIAIKTSKSETADELLLSQKCFQHIQRNSDRYTVSDLKANGEYETLQMLHNTTLKLADALYAEGRTLFAAAEYGNAAGYSKRLMSFFTDSDSINRWLDELELYAECIRQCSILTYYDGYYILTKNGVEPYGRDNASYPPAFQTSAKDYIFLVLDGYYNDHQAYGVIRKSGDAKFGVDSSAKEYKDWAALEDYTWRKTESCYPIKIFLDVYGNSPDAIVLYSDGTIDIISSDWPSSYYDLQTYDDVLDFINIYEDEFAVLQKSGYVSTTSGINLSEWKEIIEITSGTARTSGYNSISNERDYLYGLDKNGVIYYTEILTKSEAEKIPESGTFVLSEPVIKIAGDAYLTQSGILGSIEPILNEWLQVNYSNYKFSSISKGIGCNAIAATSTDGEVFIIDLRHARYELTN
jgi:lipoprotein